MLHEGVLAKDALVLLEKDVGASAQVMLEQAMGRQVLLFSMGDSARNGMGGCFGFRKRRKCSAAFYGDNG